MKINALNTLLIGGLLTGASLAASCTKGPYNRLSEYMRERNYTQKEYEDILLQAANAGSNHYFVVQSKLDSMAYRDLLKTMPATNDSGIVAEFNELAAKTNYANHQSDNKDAQDYILRLLKDDECTISEYDNANSSFIDNIQHNVDKILFGKFFKKHGLMKGKFKQQFDSISNVIIGK